MTQKIHPLLMAQRMRRQAFSGLSGPAARSGATDGAFPLPNGAPGSLVYPYGERNPLFGTDPGVGVGAPLDPSQPVPLPASSPGASGAPATDGLSIPFGESNNTWQNPTTFQLVPIIDSSPSATPVLSQNAKRNMLLIQNNSSATGAGNTAPTFYIGFNNQAQVGLSLALAPGAGVLFDIICPRDSVYVTIAGGVGVFTVAGVVGQGTYSPVSSLAAYGVTSEPGVGNTGGNSTTFGAWVR